MDEPWVVEQHWDIRYRHTADPVIAQFLKTIRDEGRLLGRRCNTCDRVLVPARAFCDRDFVETDDWVDLGDEGTIELFTIIYLKTAGLPDPPYALAYVRPDGADTALMNYVRGVDLSDPATAAEHIAIGTRVKILFGEERTGRMTDFHFELAAAS
jgi:uncharacterized OB-fold protein